MIARPTGWPLPGWDVLDTLSDGRPRTAAQLEEELGRPRRPLRAVLRRLEAAEYVRRVGVVPRRAERPSTLWAATEAVAGLVEQDRARDLGRALEAALDSAAALAALERRGVASAAELAAELCAPLVEALLHEIHASGGGAWRDTDGRWVARASGVLPGRGAK